MKYIALIIVTISIFIFIKTNNKQENKRICQLNNENIVTIGDSLANGYGVNTNDSFAIKTAQMLHKNPIKLGINGETTSQLIQRLDSTLNGIKSISAIIISIGGNDFLRNINSQITESNLDKIVNTAKKYTNCVVLLGIPSNAKEGLLNNVATIYTKIESKYNILLESKSMNQILKNNTLKVDQIHPNAAGHAIIANNIAQLINNK